MSEFDEASNLGIPEVPVVDLITVRRNSQVDQVTEDDLYAAQYNWRLVKLYRLSPERRKELCILLISLVKKLAPDLVGSDLYNLWVETAADPSSVDRVFSPKVSRSDA